MKQYDLQEFIDFIKKAYDCDIFINTNEEPDTFENLFGNTIKEDTENAM